MNNRCVEKNFVVKMKILAKVKQLGNIYHGNITFTDYHKTEFPFMINWKDEFVKINGHHANLVTTPCNYGGVRYWFECPCCYNKRSSLVIINRGLSCKVCEDLTYNSQQHTKTDFSYYYERAKQLAITLDSNYNVTEYWPNSHRFPDKPKNMHYSTYYKKKAQFDEILYKADTLWAQAVNSLMGSFR